MVESEDSRKQYSYIAGTNWIQFSNNVDVHLLSGVLTKEQNNSVEREIIQALSCKFFMKVKRDHNYHAACIMWYLSRARRF